MHDATPMRVRKRARDIAQHRLGALGGQWPASQRRLQRLPGHDLHHEREPVIQPLDRVE
jgi:hypothetical protein